MESLEQQSEGGQQGGAAEGDQTQSMSLLGGVARPEGLPEADTNGIENADGSGAGRAISQGTVLVIVVAVIAAGSIYAMRLTQGKIANERGAQVEAKMEEICERVEGTDAIIGTYADTPEMANRWIEAGAQYVCVWVDCAIYKRAVSDMLDGVEY